MSNFKAGQIINLVGIHADKTVLLEPDFGYEQDQFEVLRAAELCKLPVTIKSEETDYYWNILVGSVEICGLSEHYFKPVA